MGRYRVDCGVVMYVVWQFISPRSLSLSGNTAESAVPSTAVTTGLVTRPSEALTFFTTSIHGTPTGASEKSTAILSLSQRLLPPARSMAGLTRSQPLFSIYTGVDARALAINGSDESFLFTDLRAEQRWVLYNMNSRKWLAATNIFNSRLEALNASKNIQHIPKILGRSWSSLATWKQRSQHGSRATTFDVRTLAVCI